MISARPHNRALDLELAREFRDLALNIHRFGATHAALHAGYVGVYHNARLPQFVCDRCL